MQRGWVGDHDVLLAAVDRAGLPREEARRAGTPSVTWSAGGRSRSFQTWVTGVPLFVVDGKVALPSGAMSRPSSCSALNRRQRSGEAVPVVLDRANAHGLAGLAEMLAEDVDMFGGPCDHAGLKDFFDTYPQINWNVTSAYERQPGDAATVSFAYTRTWRDGANESRWLAVDAAEAITFDAQGRVSRIAYTRKPSEPREIPQRCPPEEDGRSKAGSQ